MATVIMVTIVLPVVVFVAIMAIVIIIILIITVVMVAVGDGCCVMQHLLFEGRDLPPQQLLQRGGVRRGRVVRLDKTCSDLNILFRSEE